MHEFELGNWRSLFTHLIRILDSVDTSLVSEMDRRYALLHSTELSFTERFVKFSTDSYVRT